MLNIYIINHYETKNKESSDEIRFLRRPSSMYSVLLKFNPAIFLQPNFPYAGVVFQFQPGSRHKGATFSV